MTLMQIQPFEVVWQRLSGLCPDGVCLVDEAGGGSGGLRFILRSSSGSGGPSVDFTP